MVFANFRIRLFFCYNEWNMDKAPKIENEVVERELSPEEKKTLADAWFNLVLGRKNDSTDVEGFTNEQMRAWLYDSLISETLVLRNEWGINPDIKRYREEIDGCVDDNEKSRVQLEFIRSINNGLANFSDSHPDGENKLKRWESWPKAMRESKSFNCVGASFLAIASMEEAGIEVFYGEPAGHAVAIAKLQNQSYVFVDLNNRLVAPIEPEEKMIDGIHCFVVRSANFDYEIMPVVDRSSIASAALGNLGGILYNVQHDIHDSDRQKERTESIYSEGKNFFDKIDFSQLTENLYKKQRDFWSDDNLVGKIEFAKVSLLKHFEKVFLGIERGTQDKLRAFLMQSPDEFTAFLLDSSKNDFKDLDPRIASELEFLHQEVWYFAKDDKAVVEKATEYLNYRIKSFSKKSTAS